jgi:glycosyltransferase involved in cell wall biosynthesis
LEGADYINVLSKKKEKVILSIRGSKVHDITMHKKLFWLRSKILIPFVYKKAHLIVTVNHGIKAELTREFGLPKDKIKTIGNFYNAVEINRLSLAPRGDLEILYNKMVLVTTGRLSPEKGLRELVKVFARLHRRMKGTRLLIVGDGPVFEELILLCYKEKLLISCGLHNLASADVIFTGQQENVFMFLRGASLYLMNSASEGFPNGLVEAIICGVPVISSDCPYGPREILAPNLTGIQPVKHPFEADCGVLMPPAEDDASLDLWVQTIANILSNEDFRKKLAQATKQKAQSFGKEKIIPHWLKIIE